MAAISIYRVCDICIGKPALRCLSATNTTVGDALSALKRLEEPYLSVWACDHQRAKRCKCIGKVCLGDIICFLAREDKLIDPSAALLEPLVSILHPNFGLLVRHLEPHVELGEAIDLILDGVQNLVIPIYSTASRKRPGQIYTLHENSRQFCWLTQEDLVRYILNSIYLFSSIANHTVESLGIVDHVPFAVHYDDSAASALPLISASLRSETAVAVLNEDDKLIAEISHVTLNGSDESVAAAIATLSVGELIQYIDCVYPPEELVNKIKQRLVKKKLNAALELLDDENSSLSSTGSMSSYSSSSDDESYKLSRSLSRSIRNRDPLTCFPWSSLIAVMFQAVSHRSNHVWVVDDEGTATGIVTYAAMLRILRARVKNSFC